MEKGIIQLNDALSSAYGWILAMSLTAIAFITPEKVSFIVVGGAIFADLFWGVVASIKQKKFILSVAFRETLKKIGVYSFALMGALSIESIAHIEGTFIAVRTVAILASVCEFWSMSASMLIVYPNMPFLKLMRGQLKGEIESKLKRNVDIDKILKD